MPRMFLFFNHTLTESQKKDAEENLNVSEFIPLPPELQKLWGNIPPELADIREFLRPAEIFLQENLKPGDIVLLQGDFGACCYFKNLIQNQGGIPVYATTRREVLEEKQGDSVIKKSVFKHIIFRKYP